MPATRVDAIAAWNFTENDSNKTLSTQKCHTCIWSFQHYEIYFSWALRGNNDIVLRNKKFHKNTWHKIFSLISLRGKIRVASRVIITNDMRDVKIVRRTLKTFLQQDTFHSIFPFTDNRSFSVDRVYCLRIEWDYANYIRMVRGWNRQETFVSMLRILIVVTCIEISTLAQSKGTTSFDNDANSDEPEHPSKYINIP